MAGRADQAQVLGGADPFQRGQVGEGGRRDGGGTQVELLQSLGHRERGVLQPGPGVGGVAGADLGLDQGPQQPLRCPPLGLGGQEQLGASRRIAASFSRRSPSARSGASGGTAAVMTARRLRSPTAAGPGPRAARAPARPPRSPAPSPTGSPSAHRPGEGSLSWPSLLLLPGRVSRARRGRGAQPRRGRFTVAPCPTRRDTSERLSTHGWQNAQLCTAAAAAARVPKPSISAGPRVIERAWRAGPRLVWSSARLATHIFMQRRRAGERPLVTPYARRAESPCPACHVCGVSAETLCDCFHKPLPRKRPHAACSSLTGLSLPFREVKEAFREVRPIAPAER